METYFDLSGHIDLGETRTVFRELYFGTVSLTVHFAQTKSYKLVLWSVQTGGAKVTVQAKGGRSSLIF